MGDTLYWFPFNAADWLRDRQIRLMPLDAQGLYLNLLANQWLEGPLPLEMEALATVAGRPQEEVERLWPHLAGKFSRRADGWVDESLESLWKRQKDQHERRVRAGQKGGRASSHRRSG